MTTLPDFYTYVKVIADSDGKVIRDGEEVSAPAKVTIRYVVVNDSHKAAGPWFVVGWLKRNGVQVHPLGQNTPVIPLQSITVQPNTVWKKEWVVTESQDAEALYVATMAGDFGAFMPNEEDEKNNSGKMTFLIRRPLPDPK